MTLSNKNVRKFFFKINDLLDITIDSEDLREEWKYCIEQYQRLMKFARKKEDFTDEEIQDFQKLADDFFKKWKKLHGLDGITNYIHMLGAGHFSYYLYKHRNLYTYSQQGWESLNSLIKQFYFRRTQQGGYSGEKGKETSRVVPIFKWMQRKLWWQYKKVQSRNKFDNYAEME